MGSPHRTGSPSCCRCGAHAPRPCCPLALLTGKSASLTAYSSPLCHFFLIRRLERLTPRAIQRGQSVPFEKTADGLAQERGSVWECNYCIPKHCHAHRPRSYNPRWRGAWGSPLDRRSSPLILCADPTLTGHAQSQNGEEPIFRRSVEHPGETFRPPLCAHICYERTI